MTSKTFHAMPGGPYWTHGWTVEQQSPTAEGEVTFGRHPLLGWVFDAETGSITPAFLDLFQLRIRTLEQAEQEDLNSRWLTLPPVADIEDDEGEDEEHADA